MGGSRSNDQEKLQWQESGRVGCGMSLLRKMSLNKDFLADSRNDIHDTKVPWLIFRLNFSRLFDMSTHL